MQKRIQELDVLRVLAMLFVITYHFGCEYAAAGLPFFNLFYLTPNYDFGNVAVTIFIALSGGLLYKKYGIIDQGRCPAKSGMTNGVEKGEHFPLRTFYLKRAKAIYPPFWILSLYIPLSMLRHLIADGNAFFMGPPPTLLLTAIGFDGYAKMFGMDTYVFCGDWFVGAIVLLYLLYPLLAKCYAGHRLATISTLGVLYALQYLIPAEHDELFSILPVTIAFKFCIGFLLVENLERFRNWRIAIIAAVALLALTVIDIPGRINTDFLGSATAIALFVVIFFVAPRLLRIKAVSSIVPRLATLAYCVFLVQHVGIVWAQAASIKIFEKMHWNFSQWNVLALLAVTLVAIMFAAWILKMVSDQATKRISKFLS